MLRINLVGTSLEIEMAGSISNIMTDMAFVCGSVVERLILQTGGTFGMPPQVYCDMAKDIISHAIDEFMKNAQTNIVLGRTDQNCRTTMVNGEGMSNEELVMAIVKNNPTMTYADAKTTAYEYCKSRDSGKEK